MSNNNDVRLKAMFAALHKQQRQQSPAFDPMRACALGKAGAQLQLSRHRTTRWVPSVAAMLLLAFSLLMTWPASKPQNVPVGSAGETVSVEQIEQLIVSIKQHVEINQTLYSPTYPTDVLLSQTGLGVNL